MAVVRELITILGTSFDPIGVKQYEKGMERVKELALTVGKVMGIAFSIDKAVEFADELVKTGKEINLIYAQLKAIARPMDDVNEMQREIFDGAQALGLSYKDVLETYREFYGVMRESKVPQEEIVQTTENIYKALRVGKASADQMTAAMEIMGNSFKRGYFRSVAIGGLEKNAPIVLDMLAKHYKTNVEGLREISKQGKITAEVLVEVFGRANKELDADFEKVPQKLGNVFTRIYNELANLTAQIYKMTEASVFMGKVVWWTWEALTWPIKKVTEAVGGLRNMVELLGIMFGLVLGPMLIRSLALATMWTIRWAIASGAAALPWIAIGIAITGVALAIQDLVYWTQNKHSLIGTWVGPFEKLAENFKNLDIFAGFRVFSDLFKGDWEKAWADAKTAVGSVQAVVFTLTIAVGLTFAAWTGLKFLSLIGAIGNVANAVKGVGEAAVESGGKVKAMTAAEGGSKGSVPPVAPVGGRGMLGFLGRLSLWAVVASLGGDTAPETPEVKAQREAQNAQDEKKYGPRLSQEEISNKYGYTGSVGHDTIQALKNLMFGLPQSQNRPAEEGGAWGKPRLQFQEWDAKPRVTPGALGPAVSGPVTNNVAPVFNQTNKIEVTTALDADQIGKIVGDKVTSLTQGSFNAFARDIKVAAPRVEAPTQ